ncbi:MAG: TolC family protein [Thiogranum sp.]|nr:TolC family protein [Thiogranum sp.]
MSGYGKTGSLHPLAAPPSLQRWMPGCLLLMSALLLPVTGAAAEPLSLRETEELALSKDVTAPRFEALAAARNDQAVADGQLPDPRLKLGAANLPIDSFDRTREPMTQMQLGVQQAFPPGRTLKLSSERANVLAEADLARARAKRAEVLREVRERYLELYYHVAAGQIIEASRELFSQLVDVTRYHYAAGRNNQQDVLRASVELSLLEDRLTRVNTDADRARAELGRYIGQQAAGRAPDSQFPQLPAPPSLEAIRAALDVHPLLQAENRIVKAEQIGVDIARQRYKPGWMLDVTYGNRGGENADGSDRDDFLSAMVTMDLPLFTDKRQDRVLATRQHEVEAVRLNREDQYLQLLRRLDSDYAEWFRLGERKDLYRQQIEPQALDNARASVAAYKSGVTEFTGVMRARITELDVRLQSLRVIVDRSKAQARLLYLAAGVVSGEGDKR